MARLFVGTFIEESHRKLLLELKQVNRSLDTRWQRKLRWVQPERQHLTWFFIGDVPKEKVTDVEQKLAAAVEKFSNSLTPDTASSFSQLTFESAELWPNPRKCRQLVLCAKHFSGHITALANEITRSLKQFSDPDAKHYDTFRPHITLFRLDAPRSKDAERPAIEHISGLSDALPFTIDLGRISLIESDLGKPNQYISLRDFAI